MTDCDNGNDMWDNMQKALENAITTFQADTNALMLSNFKLKRSPFKGGIGRINKNTNQLVSGYNYGIRIMCDSVKSGVLYIKKIGTYFETGGDIDLKIYNNLGELVTTQALTCQAGIHKQNIVDIELPLYSFYKEHLEYYLVYEYTGNPKPFINDIKCSCGGFKPSFNCSKPYFYSKHDKNYGWADWCMVGGLKLATIPDFADDNAVPCTTNNYMYGLTLEVDLKCKVNEVLCNEQLDFDGNPLAAAIALAIQNKAGEFLGNWILQSGDLNRYSVTNGEQLAIDVAKYKGTYDSMVNYIVQSADISQNDCLACLDPYNMAKRGILS
jgi:hypothetical protein